MIRSVGNKFPQFFRVRLLSRLIITALVATGCFVTGTRVLRAEDWKGTPEESVLSVGAVTGLGVIDRSSGYSIFGTVSRKIINHGFVPDITNSVSVEGLIGPIILAQATAVAYGVHLRWDFEKDKNWTFFAIGGLGGNVLSGVTEFYPRFGVGVFYKTSGPLNLRAEISHEATVVGINVPFY